MIYNELINYKCLSCDGVGILKCDCNSNDKEEYNKNCFICSGEGKFKCPLCDGEGIC